MKLDRFAKYAWLTLAFNLLVIVWGAYVRASGSGAGCGSHWPLCNGEVIPGSPTVKTIVEFSHRLSSGLALLLVAGALVWAFRAYSPKHPSIRYAASAMFFMLMEAAIGAGLVLFEMVAENKSIARALWMSAHLVNTFLLVGTLTLMAWAATTGGRLNVRGKGSINWVLAAAIVATLILGVSGAVSALGATLFPVTSLAEGLKQDLSPTAHVLIRLRFFHPLIAIGVSGLLMLTAYSARSRQPGNGVKRWSTTLIALVFVQLGAGAVNLLLHAPIWLQLLHLLLSDLVWISLVLLGCAALQSPAREPSAGFALNQDAQRWDGGTVPRP
ncbi:MAG TPA: COX15/CtaA family protein [Blastocatellia bacterium]|nr:COX15/CtaA family protein [Blastocatellia bacterium]